MHRDISYTFIQPGSAKHHSGLTVLSGLAGWLPSDPHSDHYRILLRFYYVPSPAGGLQFNHVPEEPGTVRAVYPEHPSLERRFPSADRLSAFSEGILYRGIPGCPEDQLAIRTVSPAADRFLQFYRVSPSLGPAGLLGHHRGHHHHQLFAAGR